MHGRTIFASYSYSFFGDYYFLFYSTVAIVKQLKQIRRRWTVPVRLADCTGAAPEHDQGNILWNREASQPLC